jgi:hypothetical protein
MPEDLIARGIGIAGVVLAIAGLGLTAFLWWWEGPRLRVTAFVRPESSTVRIEVASTGRLAVTLEQLELRDEFVLKIEGGSTKTEPFSRWSISVDLGEKTLPLELAPTSSITADVDIPAILMRAGDAPSVSVTAWAKRGDGRWSKSKPVRLR